MNNLQPCSTLHKLVEASHDLIELFWQATWAPSDTLTGFSLSDRNPKTIEKLLPFFKFVGDYYFRFTTDGWENIPENGRVLLIGSHNGGLATPDAVMTTYEWFHRFGTERLAYALMEPKIWQFFPGIARLAAQVGTIQAHSHLAVKALRQNAALLIYPGGVRDVFRPHNFRQQICFFENKGFIKLALREEAPIVPIISRGAHDTLIILADLYPQLNQLHQWGMPWFLGIDPGTFPIYLGLPWGLAIGPLPNIPLPVQIHIRVCPPIIFEKYGNAAAHDSEYVEACYQQVVQTMQQALDRLIAER